MIITSEKIDDARRYWLDQMALEPRELRLPGGGTIQTSPGEDQPHSQPVQFDASLKDRIHQISKGNHLSVFVFLLTVYKILLAKYLNHEDIIVASPALIKSKQEFNRWVLLRDAIRPERIFKDQLMEVSRTVAQGYKYQYFPVTKLLELMELEPGVSMFRHALILENIHPKTPPALDIEAYQNDISLVLNVNEDWSAIQGEIRYNPHLYGPDWIRRFSNRFLNLSRQVSGNPGMVTASLEWITPREKEQVLYEFSGPVREWPRQATIHGLIEKQALKMPDSVAISAPGNKVLTYAELDQRANGLAWELKNRGVQRGTIIANWMDSSMEFAIAVLAILKAGAAFMNIEPGVPMDRVIYMLKDGNATLLFSDIQLDGFTSINSHTIKTIEPKTEPPETPDSGEPAYVIYTSGTTGNPKGVLNSHAGAVNTLLCRIGEYGLKPGMTMLQLFSSAFDGFITGFFSPLAAGARMVLMSEEGRKDVIKIASAIIRQRVNHFICVPQLYMALMETLSPRNASFLSLVTLAGDNLPLKALEISRQKNPGLEISNEYGVSEAAVMSTIHRNQQDYSTILIGKPAWNTRLLIMDWQNRPQPIDVPGELHIAGTGVAMGYINNPELTASRFVNYNLQNTNYKQIPDRLLSSFNPSSYTVYKTGDLARWLPDGTVQLLGRLDHQVKIRGIRIELGEIEYRFQKYPGINEAVVIQNTDPGGEKYLCAYITGDLGGAFDEIQIQEFMSRSLPGFMVPPYIIYLDKLPLNRYGKLDRNALPLPEPVTLGAYREPENDIQKQLAAVWGETLAIPADKISIDANFFRLGGNSLKVTVLGAKIHRRFDVMIAISDIFSNPTIQQLSDFIQNAAGTDLASNFTPIQPVEKREYYPLSSAQKRLFVLQQMTPDTVAYNVPAFFKLQGKFNRARLEQTFRELVDRHEALRTSFLLLDDIPVQKIHDHVHLDISSEIPESAFVRPFDLAVAPLIRVGLQDAGKDSFVLMIDMHHIISDGVSLSILAKEFNVLYENGELEAPRIQYKDFACHGKTPGQIALMHKRKSFWQEQLKGDLPVLQLPLDFPRPALQRFDGSRVHFKLEQVQSSKLKQMALEHNTTLFSMLLAIYNIFLSRLSRQEDIIVGTPVAGRTHSHLETVIGMFVNTVVLRNFPRPGINFIQFLGSVHQRMLQAFENQDYPFEDLVESVSQLDRDTSRNPLFDVILVLQNMDMTPVETGELTLRPHTTETGISKFDMSLYGTETASGIHFFIEYCTHLFSRETIQRFIRYFKRVVEQIIAHPNRNIAAIDCLPPDEKQYLMDDFNASAEDYPRKKTIHQLFHDQVQRTPEHDALSAADNNSQNAERKFMNYAQLDRESGLLARYLSRQGIGPGSIVAIKLPHSMELVIAILGILKSGAAYLPIDPAYPEQRTGYIIADSQAVLYDPPGALDGEPYSNADSANPSDPAYVIYTSGTTGRPRGVLVHHRGLVNYISWAAKRYVGGHKRDFPLYTSISFDLTVTSVFTPLATGNAIHVYNGEDNRFILQTVIQENRVGVIKLTPSHLKMIRESAGSISFGPALRVLIAGGEQLDSNLAKEILELCPHPVEIYNEYGPTEAVVGCMIHRFDPERDTGAAVPIGVPAANMKIFILDNQRNPAPIGVPGEMYIAGDGIAYGYLNNPELTASRFVNYNLQNTNYNQIPDQSPSALHPSPIYRTGDLARHLPDGGIEFLGRIDHQVKIRGHRIELQEIETTLKFYKSGKDTAPGGDNRSSVDAFDRLNAKIKRCQRCLLPENYPGVSFDNQGVCNVCRTFESNETKVRDYFKAPDDFRRLLDDAKASSGNGGSYDCLLLFSGGKDSTYVLYKLVDMGLKVLTFTFDNGYISDAAFRNIRQTTAALNVENIIAGAKNMNQVFSESLRWNQSVCHGCWNALNMMGARLAREKNIPVVISGLSRGQIYEMRLDGLFQVDIFDESEIQDNLRLFRQSFHSRNNRFSRLLDIHLEEDSLDRIYFIDYFTYDDTPVHEIRDYLTRRGWIQPEDTGFCSSNCLINDVGIYFYLKEKGYHFYVNQLSWDCRLGSVSRQEALSELGFTGDPGKIETILKEIGYYETPVIRDVLVMERRDKNDEPYLCAYIVADPLWQDSLDSSHLREYLLQKLPDYMAPAYFVMLEQFPLTPNGKINRSALPDPVEAESGGEYTAPVNLIQQKLADIWSVVLGREKAGIHDDFFAMGGDSIKAIQVISRLGRQGYKIEMKDLFQNSTISRLAPKVRKTQRIPDQAPVTGNVPLTPVQHEFFQQYPENNHHYNHSVLLKTPDGFDKDLVLKFFSALFRHHDALRMTYKKQNGQFVQTSRGIDAELDTQVFDLRQEPRQTALAIMEREAQKLQASIDLERGPLLKLALFHHKDGCRLLAVIHHLALDGVSWRILFEDLEALYKQHQQNQPLQLPPKTDSFNLWARNLIRYAQTPRLLKEKDYWRAIAEKADALPSLPVDIPEGENTNKDRQTISIRLDQKDTALLISGVNHAFGTRVDDILLSAMGLAFKDIFAMDSLLIAMEGHGRVQLEGMEPLDTSRTVGWFTCIYPVLAGLSSHHDPASHIIEVKESLRRVPLQGVGYGILNYLTDESLKQGESYIVQPEISFNYLGQFDGGGERMTSFQIASEPSGSPLDKDMKRKYLLDVSAIISGGQLSISIAYSAKRFHKDTMNRLLESGRQHLTDLIRFCANRKHTRLTPSDLSFRDLSVSALNQLQERFDIEDILPLSPMQEGMFFHSLYSDSSAYFQQISYRVGGEFDIAKVEQSLNLLLKRHEVLRTQFIHEGTDFPLQVILKDARVDFTFKDLSAKDDAPAREHTVKSFKTMDRRRPFNLGSDPLMRVTMFRLQPNTYEFIWSYHHIIMDGWCSGILIAEFYKIYSALINGQSISLPDVPSYKTYIHWLEKQDNERLKEYWNYYLQGYSRPASLSGSQDNSTHNGQYHIDELSFMLSPVHTRELNHLAATFHVTINTIVQTVWGILLSKYTNLEDVVFGAVVSGRPPEIDGVEGMVGLFINTVPVRLTYGRDTRFHQLLMHIQEKAVESEAYHYCPLAEIQAASVLKNNLFDHILAFQNMGTADYVRENILDNPTPDKNPLSQENSANSAKLLNFEAFEHSNYHLNVVFTPGTQLQLTFYYNSAAYERSFLEQTGTLFLRLLEQVLENNQILVHRLSLLSDEEKNNLQQRMETGKGKLSAEFNF